MERKIEEKKCTFFFQTKRNVLGEQIFKPYATSVAQTNLEGFWKFLTKRSSDSSHHKNYK